MCERNIDRLPFVRPQLGTWPTTQACARLGIELATFWFVEPAQLTETHQSGQEFRFRCVGDSFKEELLLIKLI